MNLKYTIQRIFDLQWYKMLDKLKNDDKMLDEWKRIHYHNYKNSKNHIHYWPGLLTNYLKKNKRRSKFFSS